MAIVIRAIDAERDLDPDVVQRRHDRVDLGDRRGRRHRDRHDVVDEQAPRPRPARQRREVLAGHDVGAAARRVGAADLAVRERDHGQEHDDRDRHLDRDEERARAGDHEDPQDLLGGVGGGADRVGAEDRQGELLGSRSNASSSFDEPPPEEEPADGSPRPRRRRRAASDADALAVSMPGPGVPEVRRVRPLHADPAVGDLASLERPPTADHWAAAILVAPGRASLRSTSAAEPHRPPGPRSRGTARRGRPCAPGRSAPPAAGGPPGCRGSGPTSGGRRTRGG